MNFNMIRFIIGKVIVLLGVLLVLPALTGFVYREYTGGLIYTICVAVYVALGYCISRKKPQNKNFYAREGYVIAALVWIVMSILGAVPFVLTKAIPSMTDALFEIISGFTTTGASILSDPSELSHCDLLWRSFSHWIGGMGVLVFLIALMPSGNGENLFLMRAESTGPSVGKIVPRINQTSMILYSIYSGLTVLMFFFLIIGKMPLFDAVCTALGTAGTGGYGVRPDSMASYSTYLQIVVTIFMVLFGVNFNFYFFVMASKVKDAFKMEEVRWYLGFYTVITLMVAVNLWTVRGGFFHDLQQAAFQTASVMTTTGFATENYDLWPPFSKILLGLLMFVGACTGSTGGGVKISRIIVYIKGTFNELLKQLHPKRVKVICLDGKKMKDETVRLVFVYLALFAIVFIVSVVIVGLNECDWETSFSAVLATLNNIGPGFGMVGPSCNYSFLSPLTKYVLMFDMLAGRLELLPMITLFMPQTWKKSS